jgi:hypothetical protein
LVIANGKAKPSAAMQQACQRHRGQAKPVIGYGPMVVYGEQSLGE